MNFKKNWKRASEARYTTCLIQNLEKKDLKRLQYKIIKLICKILTQYQSFQQRRMQKFFKGAQKCPLAYFCFVSGEGTIILRSVREHVPPEIFCQITLKNTRF